MRYRVLAAAAAIVVGGSGLAWAQTPAPPPTPEQIITARQAGMDMVGGLAELMKAAVQSGADVQPFQEPAAAMAKWAAVYPHLFPEGTQTGGGTKAKAEVWSDRAGFEKAAAVMVAASTKLAEAAKSGDKAMFAEAFKAEGQSCGGCHRGFKNR